MVEDRADAEVRALHRAPELNHPFAVDLTHVSAERAATALVGRFATTGYAQADVADPPMVRRLIRRDCRGRRLPVRTHAVGAIVVVIDEARHSEWLDSSEGSTYREEQGDVALIALANVKPPPWMS